MDLKGKKVLITGSTSGLGRLLALEIAKQGANVIVHGRDQERIDKVLNELKAINSTDHLGVLCDLNKPETVAKSLSGIDSLDILINNAGVWLEGDSINGDPEKILELVNVNLASCLLVTRTLLPILLKSEFGQILNISSVAGVEVPNEEFYTYYNATKWGMRGFTEGLVKEFDNKNLRVMGIYPGGMETEIFTKAGNNYQKHEPWMFDPKETVDASVFMLTRDSKVIIKRLDIFNHLQK